MNIYRYEYRAVVSDEYNPYDIGKYYVKNESVNTLSVFADEKTLYLFFESTIENLSPDVLFDLPEGFLVNWPGKANNQADRSWAFMNPMFFHAIPGEISEWNKDRKKVEESPTIFRGRIAYIKPQEVSSYVYYHRALTDEGLLKGDKYHFISLHENILFSYFEEPKTIVNIKGMDEQSAVIKDYLEYGEERVFERKPGSDLNFEFIDLIFHI